MRNIEYGVEYYDDGYIGLAKIPRRVHQCFKEIEAKNKTMIPFPRGINCIRIHEGNIFQIAGYNDDDGLYCYLINSDGTRNRSF